MIINRYWGKDYCLLIVFLACKAVSLCQLGRRFSKKEGLSPHWEQYEKILNLIFSTLGLTLRYWGRAT